MAEELEVENNSCPWCDEGHDPDIDCPHMPGMNRTEELEIRNKDDPARDHHLGLHLLFFVTLVVCVSSYDLLMTSILFPMWLIFAAIDIGSRIEDWCRLNRMIESINRHIGLRILFAVSFVLGLRLLFGWLFNYVSKARR